MTKEYWNKAHVEKYSKSEWAKKPTIFAGFAAGYFPKTGILLDIGTGQGQDAAYFSSLGYSVTATDYSLSAIEHAKAKVGGVTFLHLDTSEGLPFADESFDIVYSHLALHYWDIATTKSIFKDIHRILKPGGILATITNTIDDPEATEAGAREIEPGFYKTTAGILKRYFSTDSLLEVAEGLFTPLLIDAKGETYKDEIKTLIRFIGKK